MHQDKRQQPLFPGINEVDLSEWDPGPVPEGMQEEELLDQARIELVRFRSTAQECLGHALQLARLGESLRYKYPGWIFASMTLNQVGLLLAEFQGYLSSYGNIVRMFPRGYVPSDAVTEDQAVGIAPIVIHVTPESAAAEKGEAGELGNPPESMPHLAAADDGAAVNETNGTAAE